MNGATLITELRSFTGTTSSNYSDTLALIDLNKSYHYIEDCITQEIGEKFFYTEIETNPTVAAQKDYDMPSSISGNLDGTNKVLSISVDYGDGYVKATKIDVNSLVYDYTVYSTNQSTSEPLYTIQDNKVTIYPTPTATSLGKIRFSVIQNLIDLTASTAETDVFNGKIHKKYHPLIALGAEQYAYIRRNLKQEAQESESRFQGKLFGEYVNGKYVPGMLDILNTRTRGARIRQMPTGYNVPN